MVKKNIKDILHRYRNLTNPRQGVCDLCGINLNRDIQRACRNCGFVNEAIHDGPGNPMKHYVQAG